MKITMLGTGTSTGVPQIGCNCDVCLSDDHKDKRLRCSILVETKGKRILIDCGPDFREQMLRIPFGELSAIFITHEHYDHVGGIDDLRPFCKNGNLDIYAEDFCATHLEERLPYCFAEKKYPGVPKISLHRIEPHKVVSIGQADVLPIRVMHGKLPIVGFRIGSMAYITDMLTINEEEMQYLMNLDVLIVNGLRHEWHNSHQTIEHAVQFSQMLNAKQTYLTHLGHHAGKHCYSGNFLPSNVSFAYDGQTICL